jgi:hypothetical protein
MGQTGFDLYRAPTGDVHAQLLAGIDGVERQVVRQRGFPRRSGPRVDPFENKTLKPGVSLYRFKG